MQLTSDPDAVLTGDGRLVVFARGLDNAIWHRWQVSRNGNWSNWESLGSNAASGPGAALNAPGGLVVFIRGTDNAIWHRWQNRNNGDWSGWESLGGAFTSDPDAVLTGDGRLVVFARGTDNAIWHRWQVSRNGNWSNWESLGNNAAGGPGAALNSPGGLVVFIRGTDNAIWHRWQSRNNGDWSGWESLGGVFTSDPDAVVTGDGRLVVFARGTDNAIWHRWQVSRNGDWSNWESLGSNAVGGPGAALNAPGGLVAFTRATDSAIWHRWQNRNNGDWSGWESLGSPQRAPQISSFAPVSGRVNTEVAITGSNLDWVTAVRFGGTNASFRVDSSTKIVTTVPVGAISGPISVMNPDGTATGGTFTVHLPPQISSFAPASGRVNSQVTINGTEFNGATAVRFGGIDARFQVESATKIVATVPIGATDNPMSVTTLGGTATSTNTFTVEPTPPPQISSFTPASGRVNSQVTINGTELNGATAVRFGGIDARFQVESATKIVATVPIGATNNPMSVTTPGGTATSTNSFTVEPTPPPQISSFTPASGRVNSQVTINGTEFNGATAVRFGGINASFQVESATKIVATVPIGAISGPVSVTTIGGTATSTNNFTVQPTPPQINSFTPTSGRVNSEVTILGSEFTGATAVRFGGINASFRVESSTKIVATVPTGAVSGPVSVTTVGGTATSTNSFTVEPTPVPIADLAFLRTWMEPTHFPSQGQAFTVFFTFVNGGTAATGPFTIRLELDGGASRQDISAPSYQPLGGDFIYWSFPQGLAAGSHHIYGYLDIHNQVREVSETNNVIYIGFSVWR